MRGGGVAMYRIAMEKLMNWKESKRRKPLIIEGARQVGKTWLMKEFGKNEYTNVIYANFDLDERLRGLFQFCLLVTCKSHLSVFCTADV